MPTKNMQIRPVGTDDYGTVLHPETNTDMVLHKNTGKSITDLLNDTGWIDATLAPGWSFPNGGLLQYRKIGYLVYLRGFAINDSGNAYNIPLTTLPEGFRPKRQGYVFNAFKDMSITSGGVVMTDSDAVDFDGVFPIA